MDKRLCTTCKIEKDDLEFPKNSQGLRGRGRKCLQCSSEWQAEYREKYPLKRIMSKFSIELLEDAQRLYEADSCEICRRTKDEVKLVIDHCHETNKVRGKLCDTCNKGLGQFYDKEDWLLEAVLYLRKHRDG